MLHIECDDPAVGSAVERWLKNSALVISPPLTIRLKIGDPSPIPSTAGQIFRQGSVEIVTQSDSGETSLGWTLAPATARLEDGVPVAEVVLSPEAAKLLDMALRSFFLAVVIFLVRRAGYHHVHAATAQDPEGNGWLFAGNAQAGKSTTAALLASWGWAVGTDDIAFLAAGHAAVDVVSFREPIALRPGGYDLLQRHVGVPIPERDKVGCTPEELGGSWAPRVTPNLVLFPTVGDGCTSVSRIPAREALVELVKWSAWVVLEPSLAQEHLELLTRLAKQARSFRITLGRDLFSDPSILNELTA
ncbi:MAG: hypothetical protein ACE5HT_15735 [Gemmatimonadales bacterium]